MIVRLKRFFAACVSAAMVTAALLIPSVNAAEDIYSEANKTEYQNNIGLLKAVGVVDKAAEYDISKIVTRGEMIKTVMGLIGINGNPYSDEQIYSDVDAKNPYYSYICAATQIGIISGDGGMFRPDDKALYEEAAKIVVTILGYDIPAQSRGGYPEGYLATASELGLLKNNVGYRGYALSWFGFTRMLANALECDLMMNTSSNPNEPTYEIVKDSNLLNENFDIESVKGVVTRNRFTSLDGKQGVYNNAIAIDGTEYSTDFDTSDFIGCTVKAYIKDDDGDKSVIFIDDYAEYNNILRLEAGDITDFSDYKYKYRISNGREKTAKVETKFNFVYNNRTKTVFDESDLIPDDGYVLLIDSNKDSVYDTVRIYEYKYVLVNSTDKSNMYIYGKYGNEKIQLTDTEFLSMIDEKGKSIEFKGISSGDLLRILADEDENVVYINVYTTYVKGEIQKIGTNERDYTELTIDGKTYELIKNPIGDSFNVGDSGILYITDDGKGAVFEKGLTSGSQLGVIVNAFIDYEGDERVWFRIYTEKGVIVKPIGALKIKIDGVTYKNCDEIVNIFKQGTNDIVVQPVMFATNEDGEVNEIDTAYNINARYDGMDPLEVVPPANETETGLRRLYKGTKTYFNSQKSFEGQMNLSNSTKIFQIPANPKSASEKEFSIASADWLANTRAYTVDAYSSTESNVVADIVLMDGGVVSASNVYGVVNDIETSYNPEDDNITTKLTVTSWNRTEKLYTEDLELLNNAAAYSNSEDTNTYRIEKGDFIAYSANDLGEIKSVSLIFDASETDENIRFKAESNPTPSNFNGHNRVLYGKVGENHNGVLSVVKLDGTTEACGATAFKILKYNKVWDNITLQSISATNIFDEKSYGDDADSVLAYSDYAEGRIMIVY
jgi:hypothetical protein